MVRPEWVAHVLVALLGVGLFAVVNVWSGRLDANDGLGWDGRQYAHMVTDRLVDGNKSTQTRPLLPLLARIPHATGLDVIPAFQVVNFLSAFVLYLMLGLILEGQGAAPAYRLFFVANVALSIATAKMFAFYPVQIDLGALAILTSTTWLALTRTGWLVGAAALVAVTAREFSIAAAFLGLHRHLRLREPLVTSLLLFAPAVAALFLLRQWAVVTNLGDRDSVLVAGDALMRNLELWRQPAFVGFFLYFLLTLLGGVTVLLAAKGLWCLRRLARQPELVTFSVLIVGAAACGNADIWRYLVFLLPVLAVLFGQYVREFRPGPAVLAAVFLCTVVTQKPFTPMEMTTYFRDWFPVYHVQQLGDSTSEFWNVWALRFVLALTATLALAMLQRNMPAANQRPAFD